MTPDEVIVRFEADIIALSRTYKDVLSGKVPAADLAPLVADVVTLVETELVYSTGEEKKAAARVILRKVSDYLNLAIDIPWVPESIETVIFHKAADLIADYLIDFAVALYNKVGLFKHKG